MMILRALALQVLLWVGITARFVSLVNVQTAQSEIVLEPVPGSDADAAGTLVLFIGREVSPNSSSHFATLSSSFNGKTNFFGWLVCSGC